MSEMAAYKLEPIKVRTMGEEVLPPDAPACRVALIGADHRANPTNFWSASAMQRTRWEHPL